MSAIRPRSKGGRPRGPLVAAIPIRDRLWAAARHTPEGCWEWTGSVTRDGYGEIGHEHRIWRAHRLSYILAVGPIEPGQVVRHTCDNPPCVNPAHLLVGTQKDNVRDMMERGHFNVKPPMHPAVPLGEAHHNAKLTEDAVRVIRASSETNGALGLRFGVSRSAVSRARAGRWWKHVA